MEIIDVHTSLSEKINAVLDMVAVVAFWIGLAWMTIRYIRKSMAEKDAGKNLYMGIVVCLEMGALIFLIYYPFPQFLGYLSHHTVALDTIRLPSFGLIV